ncbi:MAG: CPBP family intramembrane metalloprotease [Lachnospiraceae bacterium]|nr:CPBP family intramembrane metalloprotease [Lachnospiraceae bacterium]
MSNDNPERIINNEEKASVSKGAVIYIILVFVITYIYEYIFVIRYLNENGDRTIASIPVRLSIAMFIPALCVVITRLLNKEGFKNSFLSFNLKEGRYKYYLLTWFVPSLLTLAGTVIYFLCFRNDYSPGMEYIIATYEKQGVKGLTPESMRVAAISQGITAILIAPVINCITCFGEEWGWRGYLLPKLSEKFKTLPLMLVTGGIWGLWHLPLILAGHNYGKEYTGYPIAGILAMMLFCFSVGTLLSYATLKTGSCVPAIIGHGAVNGFSSIGILFTKDGGQMLFGPSPAGVIAGIPCLIFAIILIRLMIKDEEKQK